MQVVETVSVVVTDLVGSTRMESRIGPVAADALREEHFLVLRAALEAAGGDEVKTMGDGLMIVFHGAAHAVACAVSIQQRMERRNRRALEPLGIRVGIALGDATPADGDWFGPAVVEAVRLCDRAVAGQILASELVQLIGARDGHPFSPVGELALKGLPQPVIAYEIEWEPARGWAADVPPPARLHAAASGRYVGRTDERARVEERWHAARGGARQTVFVEGEPGIGKTRFTSRAALELHDDGATVLLGRCVEEVRAPYGAFIEALSHLVEHAPDDALREHVERHGGELSRLVPALRRRLPSAPAPAETSAEAERYLLFAAVVGLLEQVSAESPTVLVLDDLHWADAPTLTLLKYLIEETHECRLLIVGTYRYSDVSPGSWLAQVRAVLPDDGAVMQLHGLTEPEVVTLMELAARHPMDKRGRALARAINEETDGNPLFVTEILRHLVESKAVVQGPAGRWEVVGRPDDLGLPRKVEEVVLRRVERLGRDARRVLATAAVIGRDFEFELLARVLQEDPDELLDVLDAGAVAALLHEHPERTGCYAFAHNVINHTLYEALGKGRRARLHRRVAEALEDLCGADAGPRAAELARHWAEAVAPVETAKAIAYSRQAGDRAMAGLAPDDALRWFRQALDLLVDTQGDTAAERCDLQICLGEAQRQAGRPDFRATLLGAARLAEEHDDADRAARAVLANNRGFASAFGAVDVERVAAIERALELDRGTDPARRARLLALQAMELQFDADHGRRRELADHALRLARQSGDVRMLPYVLRDFFHAIWSADTLEQRRRTADEMAELADRVDDPLARVWALDRAVHVAAESGELGRAAEALRDLTVLSDELGQPGLRWHATYYAAGLAHERGQLDEAERLAEAAMSLAERVGEPDAPIVHASQIGLIRVEQGRPQAVVETLQQAVAAAPGIPAFEAGLAVTLCDLGREREAAALLDRATETRFAGVPRDQVWSTALATWSRVAGDVRCERAAAQLYDMLAPHRDHLVWNGTTGYGSVEAYLGLLASTLGARDRAEEHFAAASATHRREGVTGWEARNLGYQARALLVAGHRERARAVADAALRMGREVGWVAACRRAQAVLAQTATTEVRL